MHPMRLTGLVLALAVVACDPTAPTLIGFANGGGNGGGGAHTLAFIVQPSGAVVGQIITPGIQVAARDTLGNTDPTFTGTVTIALGSNPSGARPDGTTTVALVSGIALFGDLSVDKVGDGYTLVATAPGATSATSAGFSIVAPASGAAQGR
jgi:hypothetical protein